MEQLNGEEIAMNEADDGGTHVAERAGAGVLAVMAQSGAQPRDGQVTAVRALLEQPKRVMVVQATGRGRSLVYWAATLARRTSGGRVGGRSREAEPRWCSRLLLTCAPDHLRSFPPS